LYAQNTQGRRLLNTANPHCCPHPPHPTYGDKKPDRSSSSRHAHEVAQELFVFLLHEPAFHAHATVGKVFAHVVLDLFLGPHPALALLQETLHPLPPGFRGIGAHVASGPLVAAALAPVKKRRGAKRARVFVVVVVAVRPLVVVGAHHEANPPLFVVQPHRCRIGERVEARESPAKLPEGQVRGAGPARRAGARGRPPAARPVCGGLLGVRFAAAAPASA